MWKTLALALSVVALVAGCGDDDDDADRAASVDRFCATFEQRPAVGTGLGDQAAMDEALVYFQALEEDAPQEIEGDLETLTSGLESIVEAFADFDGTEGTDALAAVEEAADVSFDELAEAASTVEDFAAENCEEVEPTE